MLTCVGIGPGDLRLLTQWARERIEAADCVAGFTNVVDRIDGLVKDGASVVRMGYKDQTAKLAEVAARHHAGGTCVVVLMGDPHFSGFQLLDRVEQACGHRVEVIPGISSAQVLASRCRVCFDETTFITFHRRGEIASFQHHLIHVLRDGRNAIVLPRPWDFMPKEIAAYLLKNGIDGGLPVEVWENLTADEASWRGSLEECRQEFSDMSLMLLRGAGEEEPRNVEPKGMG